VFIDKSSFLDVTRDYMVQEGIHFKIIKNEPYKYTAKCEDKNCSWRMHASILYDGSTYQVKTIKGSHSCNTLLDNPAATYRWIVSKLFENVRANPNMSVKGIKNALMEKYNLHKTHNTICKAKRVILDEIMGKHEEGFSLLASFTEMIKVVNPGSICYIKWKDAENEGSRPIFQRIFVCFKACKEGFMAGCRKFIRVDGTHLKGFYKGVLLTTMGIDAQNHCVPLAYVIVDVENKDNWSYFFNCLRGIIRN